MKLRVVALAVALAAGVLTSCTSGAELRVTGTSAIIDGPRRGPELCVGGVDDSMPPGCTGVPLRGVDVRELDGAQSASGTTWVDRASVTGVYDDGVLEVEEVGPPLNRPQEEAPDFSPVCPTPPDGWPPVDERADAIGRVGEKIAQYRNGQPTTYSALWYDAKTGVYTALFTEDLDRHRAALERILPGRVCIARGRLTARMLTHISNRLHKGPSAAYLKKHDITVTGASVDEREGRVEIDVVIGGAERQRRLDERYGKYGAGVVVIRSALLRPL